MDTLSTVLPIVINILLVVLLTCLIILTIKVIYIINDAKGISFVFYNPNINQWYNNNLKDFQIRFSN